MNEKFKEYLQDLATGYGLGALPAVSQPASSQIPAPAQAVAQPTETVEGQVLEKVQPMDTTDTNDVWYLGLVIMTFFISGIMYQLTIRPEFQPGGLTEITLDSSERLSAT